jgi:glutamate 5-kinase
MTMNTAVDQTAIAASEGVEYGESSDPASTARERLLQAGRVVVKVGSSLLVNQESGYLNISWLESLADDLTLLRRRGQQVILVSSGAIALGRRRLGLPPGRLRLEDSQAAAAVGQIHLAHAYKEIMARRGVVVAQILLTLEDSERRGRYLNARATFEALITLGTLPIINENDTVATAEIRYGDNDRLAARVSQMVTADCLVLLSDVEGLFTADPNRRPDARLIREVERITPDIEAMAAGSISGVGSGGMATKIVAAKTAVAAGCHMCIAAGHYRNPLSRIIGGAACTWFRRRTSPLAARKQWIAGSLRPMGAMRGDARAIRSLRVGKSLLPVGVIGVDGSFERGDTVSVLDEQGHEVARGITAYSIAECRQLMTRKTAQVETILGTKGPHELIAQRDLALLDDWGSQ